MRVLLVLSGFEVNDRAVARSNMKLIFTTIMKLAVERFYIALRSRIPVWSGMAHASTLPILELARKENITSGAFNPETVRSNVLRNIRERARRRLTGRRTIYGRTPEQWITERMHDGEAAGSVDLIIGDGTFDFDYTSEVVQMNVYDETRWHSLSSAANAMIMFLNTFLDTLTQEQIQQILQGKIKNVRSFLRPNLSFFTERPAPRT